MHSFAQPVATGLFLLLVAGLFGAIRWGLRAALRRAAWPAARQHQVVRVVGLGLGSWLAVLAGLAAAGFFANFHTMPPRLLLVLLPPLLGIGWLARSAVAGELLRHVPARWLLGLQSFRVLMEIILWLLFVAQVVPVQMTFEGRNGDILAGLTAPLLLWLLGRYPAARRPLVLAWNIAGLGLLLNIVVVALLSAPLPFRYFMNEPANTIVADFPFVWLPGFVVPVALALHVLSLRQLTDAALNEE